MAQQRPLVVRFTLHLGSWLQLLLFVTCVSVEGLPRRAQEQLGSSAGAAGTQERPQQAFAQRLTQQMLHQHATAATQPQQLGGNHHRQPHQHQQHQQHQHQHHTNPRMHHGNASASNVDAAGGAAATAQAAAVATTVIVPPGNNPSTCTMGSPSCFNLERCRRGFSLYVYPPPPGAPLTCSFGSDSPLTSLDKDEVRLYGACFLHTLLNRSSGLPLVTRPQDACVLVPALDANCAFNTCDELRLAALGAELAALPHWDGGRNHLVFNYNNDWEHARFDAGNAVVARASWVKHTYRRGFDIQLPLTRPKITPPDPWVLAWGEQLLEADRSASGDTSSRSSSSSSKGSSGPGTAILSPWQKLDLAKADAGSAASNSSRGAGVQAPRRRLAGAMYVPTTMVGAGSEDTEALGGRLWSWDSQLLPEAQQPQHLALQRTDQSLQHAQTQSQPRRQLHAAATAAAAASRAGPPEAAFEHHSPHARHLAWWLWPWSKKKDDGGGSSSGGAVKATANFDAGQLKGPLRHDLLLYFNGCLLPSWYDCDKTRPRLFDVLNSQMPPSKPASRRNVVLQARCCGDHSAGPAAAHCGGCNDNRREGRYGAGMGSCTADWPDMSFQEGMRRAQFALSPRGCGSQSYRLLEGAGLGSVPVHVGDSTVLPFDGEAGLGRLWAACVVDASMEEVEAGKLLPRLRALEGEAGGQAYVARQGACARLAALRSWEVRVVALHTVCTLALRVEAQFAAGGGAAGGGAAGGEGRMPEPMRQLCASVGALP